MTPTKNRKIRKSFLHLHVIFAISSTENATQVNQQTYICININTMFTIIQQQYNRLPFYSNEMARTSYMVMAFPHIRTFTLKHRCNCVLLEKWLDKFMLNWKTCVHHFIRCLSVYMIFFIPFLFFWKRSS